MLTNDKTSHSGLYYLVSLPLNQILLDTKRYRRKYVFSNLNVILFDIKYTKNHINYL